uniref:Uncharacterized protein n=1 Tax=Phaeocystis antarctica TaxID=33657 RepID=A0A7S0EM95_9EUKA
MPQAATTEQSWARSAKLAEFARLKDTVIRMEKSSREQLQLETETQHSFDFMRAEIGRIKQSIAALSSVVDDELASLRSDVGVLREEVGHLVESARAEHSSTASLLAESRAREMRNAEWVQQSFAQAREQVAQLKRDLSDSKAQLLEASGSHTAAVSELSSNLAEVVASTRELQQQARANSEGVSGNTAARIVATGENRRRLEHEAKVAEEARGDLQREIDALVAWSTQEARPQLARLADTGGLDGVQALAQSAHDHAATLQQSHQAAEQKLSVASEELSRHRDAIVLVVDTVDNLSRDIKATQEGLGSGLSEVREVSDQRARLMERACSHLSGECDALRYGIRRGEQRTQEQAEAVGLLQLAQGRSAEWQKASEQEVSEVRHEIASQVWP